MLHKPGNYIWPPRPETVIPPGGIAALESKGWWGQPKMNGSCSELITNGSQGKFMSRHKDTFTYMKLDMKELNALHRHNGHTVLVGEYMNKSQKGSDGKVWNQKFVIFDMLMLDGKHLGGQSFKIRQEMLDLIYPEVDKNHSEVDFLSKISENVFRCRNFKEDLTSKFDLITKIGMYEGWVFKNPDAKLENGLRQKNNTVWQAKCRKPTKNYSF